MSDEHAEEIASLRLRNEHIRHANELDAAVKRGNKWKRRALRAQSALCVMATKGGTQPAAALSDSTAALLSQLGELIAELKKISEAAK